MDKHPLVRYRARRARKKFESLRSLPAGRAPLGLPTQLNQKLTKLAIRVININRPTPELQANSDDISPPNEINNNLTSDMLGARARAAEYLAAKAASARQATRDAEEQKLPPKSTPISLSAFTKNTSISRNKGTKAWKPLVLSDSTEEETGMNDLDLHLDPLDSSSSPIAPTPTNRPASLPSMNPSSYKYANQHLMGTPFKGVPVAPRAMLPIEEHPIFGYSVHLPLFASPIMSLPTMPTPGRLPHPLTPLPQGAWYFPNPEFLRPPHSHHQHDSGLPPAPPYSEPRVHRPVPLVSRDLNSSPPRQKDEHITQRRPETPQKKPMRQKVGYIFGPDDVSPTKCEIKESHRRMLFDKHPNNDQTSLINSTPDECCAEPLSDVFADYCESQQCGSLIALEVDPATMQVGQERQRLFPPEDASRLNSLGAVLLSPEENKTVANTLASTQSQTEPRLPLHSHRIPMRVALPLGMEAKAYSRAAPKQSATHDSFQSLVGHHSEDVSRTTPHTDNNQRDDAHFILPPPGFEHLRKRKISESFSPNDSVTSYGRNFAYSFTDMNTEDWCNFNPLTLKEKEQMRETMKKIRASLTIDVSRELFQESRTLSADTLDMEAILEQQFEIQQTRRDHVAQVASEMAHKWQVNHESPLNVRGQDDVRAAVGLVKGVGNAMAALNQYADEPKDTMNPRMRSFAAVPEYATEKSVHVGGIGSRSLFESDDAEGSTAPARIARDPRYRSQHIDGLVGRPEDKIARLLGTGRRI